MRYKVSVFITKIIPKGAQALEYSGGVIMLRETYWNFKSAKGVKFLKSCDVMHEQMQKRLPSCASNQFMQVLPALATVWPH